MKKLWYPSLEDAKKANQVAVNKFRATKAERFQVLSSDKIKQAINLSKKGAGNIERRSARLLKGFSDKHAFASANRRTGYILMNQFLWKNKGYMIAKKKEFTAKLFKELRRKNISEDKIIKWYKQTKKHI